MNITQRNHISEIINPGDYCFVGDSGKLGIVLACPFCGVKMSCAHTVLSKEPLTLIPSIVGPDAVKAPCGHHFHITQGQVCS